MDLKIGQEKEKFYQWDTGQTLVVDDERICREVHFCRMEDAVAMVCPIREEGTQRVVDVPNILLQKAETFRAYLQHRWEDGTQTRFVKSFPVTARPKPADYAYTETEVLNYQNLAERIENLEQKPVEPGVKSWAEIADKPFGVIGQGDTLEWDGNPFSPKTIIPCGHPGSEAYDSCYTFYKVSDAVITAEDLANGAITKLWREDLGGELGVQECTFENGSIVQKEDGGIWLSAQDTFGNQMDGYEIYCYPENSTYPAGIYFGAEFNYPGINHFITALTIPGYGKFPVTKKLTMEVMPKPLQLGEREGFSNTILWDGDTTGLVPHPDPNEQGWFILSDVVVTAEDRAKGVYVEIPAPGSEDMVYAGINSNVFWVNDTNPDDVLLFTYDENGNQADFLRFTSLGILVTNWSSYWTDYETMATTYYYIRLHSLTIPGCNKFPVTVNKTIDKKYLPKAAGVVDCQSEYVSAGEFNDLLKSLRDAGYLGKAN